MAKVKKEEKQFGLAFAMFNEKGKKVEKTRYFKSLKSREKFLNKRKEDPTFIEVITTMDPPPPVTKQEREVLASQYRQIKKELATKEAQDWFIKVELSLSHYQDKIRQMKVEYENLKTRTEPVERLLWAAQMLQAAMGQMDSYILDAARTSAKLAAAYDLLELP